MKLFTKLLFLLLVLIFSLLYSGNFSKRFELPSYGGEFGSETMSMSNSDKRSSRNRDVTGSKKSLTLQDGLIPPLDSSDISNEQQNSFSIPGDPDAVQAPEAQPLPDASSFNMNENSADKVMKQVDSFSESHPDIADNVLKHLTSHNSAEASDDRNIVKNLPSEVKSELQTEEKSLAEDESVKKQTLAEGQVKANQNLQNALSSIADKEKEDSSAAIKETQDMDMATEKSLSDAAETAAGTTAAVAGQKGIYFRTFFSHS